MPYDITPEKQYFLVAAGQGEHPGAERMLVAPPALDGTVQFDLGHLALEAHSLRAEHGLSADVKVGLEVREAPLKIYTFANNRVAVDPIHRSVYADDQEVRLSSHRFGVLSLLASTPDEPWSADALMWEVWGDIVNPNNLQYAIFGLRANLGRSLGKAIKTIYKVGYVARSSLAQN